MNNIRAYLGGLLYGLNRALFVLILAHLGQGLFMACHSYTTGNLSFLWGIALCSAVVLICLWRIYRSLKIGANIRQFFSEL